MRSIEDTLIEIDMLIIREEDELQSLNKQKLGATRYAFKVRMRLEVLREVKELILGL